MQFLWKDQHLVEKKLFSINYNFTIERNCQVKGRIVILNKEE